MADFQRHKADLNGVGARIVAFSSDAEPEARETVERLGLAFTVLYGLDPEATSRTIGCYTGMRGDRPHIQPAAFVLGPDGRIAHAVYSSGNVGRFTADDALTVLSDLRK